MPIDLFPDRVIIQTAVTKRDHEKLWKWWVHGEPGRGAIVRAALTHYFDERADLEKISEQLQRIETLLVELVAERMGE